MFFLTKTVKIRWNWRCKIFFLKIRRCKIFDKFRVCSLSILTVLLIIRTAIIQIRSKERARCFACEQNSRLLLGTKCEMRQISVWTALRELEMAKPRIKDWDSVDWERWECEKESKSIKSRQQNHKQNIGTERGERGSDAKELKMLTVECEKDF